MGFLKANNWPQTITNLGIIAGLVLVGVQMKQNTDLLKTQLLYEESRRIIEQESQYIGENGAEVWAKSLTAPQDLSLAERRIMEALLWSYAEQLRSTRQLAEFGLLNDEEWRLRVRTETLFMLGNPYGRAWWKRYSEDSTSLPSDLFDAVNERLRDNPGNITLDYIEAALENLELNSASVPTPAVE